MAAADTARLIASLELRDKEFLAAVKRSTGAVDTLDKRLSKVGNIAAGGIRKAGQNLERGLTVGAFAAGGAIAYTVKQAIDLESAVAGVNKTVEGTPEQLKAVTDGVIALSNRLPLAREELFGIAEAGGAMGVAREDLLAFTETAAILGTTTNVAAEDAAVALGQLQNVIGLTGDEFDNFAASLVDLGNKGASTEAQILEIARRAGGAARLAGVAKEATLGWAAAAANLGLNEELAGTALQNFFVKTQNVITNGGKNLDAFAKIAGQTAEDFKESFDTDASGALETFLTGLGKLPKDKRLQAVQKFFGKGSGLTRLILGLADSVENNLTPSLETSATAWEQNTAATAEAEKRFKTTAAQMQTLRNNIDNAAATIGSALLPVLNELAQEAVTWLQDPKTQAGLKAFSEDLAKGAREAVTWLKSLDWNAIANALKAGAGFAQGLVNAFVNAPPWLQQFLTVGFVANKFSGGAITSILGELAKGLILTKLGITAGTVIVTGGSVVGGVGGVGAAPTGGGKLGAAAKVVSLIIPVAVGAEIGKEIARNLGANVDIDADLGPLGILIGRHVDNNTTMVVGHLNGVGAKVSDNTQATLRSNERLESIRATEAAANAQAIADSASERAAINAAKAQTIAQLAGDSSSERTAIANAASAQQAAQARTTEAARSAAAAIRDKDLSVSVNTTVQQNVSVNGLTKQVATYSRLFRTNS